MYINKNNLFKYLIQFIIVSLTVYNLSPCNIKLTFSLLIGLISASLFAIIDTFYPIIIDKEEFKKSSM